jgi:hypothetical protein
VGIPRIVERAPHVRHRRSASTGTAQQQAGAVRLDAGRSAWAFDGFERTVVSTCEVKLYGLADAEDVVAAALESVVEVGRWMGWCHPGYSLDEARDWISPNPQITRT